jgi:tRNA 2-selenouridine synthase
MSDLIDKAHFEALFLGDTSLLDLRSPGEFVRGSFPHTRNLPLLTDEERHAVGLCYKQRGQAAAVALGDELVSGQLREERMRGWSAFFAKHPHGALYCWRGGLRSETVQEWLRGAGIMAPRVSGGYKALRQYLIDATEEAAMTLRFLVLGGRTGSGKTKILTRFAEKVDLEALAHHRGSTFGSYRDAQPTPVEFENALAIALLKCRAVGSQEVLVEDESRTIGRLAIPLSIHQAMSRGQLVVLEADDALRVDNILAEYVREPLSQQPAAELEATLCAALGRIQRRLGGARHVEIQTLMRHAFAVNDDDAHRTWIERLLTCYYDPQYDHQLTAKSERIVFRGGAREVSEFLADRGMTVIGV